MTEHIEKILNYEIKNIPESVLKKSDVKLLHKSTKEQVELKFQSLSNGQRVKMLMKASKHPNKNIADYFGQMINPDKNSLVISTIAFRDSDSGRIPFVRILCKNFNLLRYRNFDKLKNEIYKSHKMFKPEFLEFFEYSNSKSSKFDRWDNIVAGHIDTIKKIANPERHEEVIVKKVRDLSFYEEYCKEYKELRKLEMFETESIISKSDFKFYLDNGLICKIIINKDFAGLIAAHKTTMKYLIGYYIVEKVLFGKYRGQNYAAAAEKKFIGNLKAAKHEFVYGNIFTKNKPSLKTALKCGRHIEGSIYKINF